MARLNIFVHVVELEDDGAVGRSGTFGPDDELPDWAVRAISNSDVWAQAPDRVAADRPRGNASREVWFVYALDRDIEVNSEMSRDEIIAAVDAAAG